VTCRRPKRPTTAWGSVLFTVVLAVLVLVPAARTHDTRSEWPYQTLILRIAGKPVTLADRRIRVDRDLVICSGDGTATRRGGIRRWKHFTCTQALFDRNGVDRDITFRVHVVSRTRFLITNARYGPD
jgi:hypothetical protein